MSNFLGDPEPVVRSTKTIISGNELIAREGLNLTKGMNFRDKGELLSVFLVLPSHDGEFKDEWHPDTLTYVYEGHDSTTVESGKVVDQLLMYESGKVTDNGKFYRAANEFKEGIRKGPLQIQVYEKLDPGIWFDKGIFKLIDAVRVIDNGRKVYKFHLMPSGAFATGNLNPTSGPESMIAAALKAEAWKRFFGHCEKCKEEKDLKFVVTGKSTVTSTKLMCAKHRGETIKKGLLG